MQLTLTNGSLLVVGGLGVAYYFAQRRQSLIKSCDAAESSPETYHKRHFTKLLRIPRRAVGAVLGRHGSVIRKIEWETKTFLHILYHDQMEKSRMVPGQDYSSWDGRFDEESWDDTDKRQVDCQPEYAFLRIQAGSERQIELVTLAVQAILEDFLRKRVTERISVPSSAVGFIIGKDGSNIKRINYMCNVRIQVGQTGSAREEIEIRGTEEGVAAAILRIEAAVAKSSRLSAEAMGLDTSGNKNSDLMDDINQEMDNIEQIQKLLEEPW